MGLAVLRRSTSAFPRGNIKFIRTFPLYRHADHEMNDGELSFARARSLSLHVRNIVFLGFVSLLLFAAPLLKNGATELISFSKVFSNFLFGASSGILSKVHSISF